MIVLVLFMFKSIFFKQERPETDDFAIRKYQVVKEKYFNISRNNAKFVTFNNSRNNAKVLAVLADTITKKL